MMTVRRMEMTRILLLVVLATASLTTTTCWAFTGPTSKCAKQAHSVFLGRRTTLLAPSSGSDSRSSRGGSSLNMFLGSDGGILGVGAPEVAVTLLVGYFVLGPSDLYKLVKEIGKFIQNFRTLGAEATKTFESTMENQLELTELRRAQRELNEAFSFRRSINTDEMAPAFAEGNAAAAAAATAASAAEAGNAMASTAVATEEEEGTGMKKKRRLVRRKKKKVVAEEEQLPSSDQNNVVSEYPDLDMLDTEFPDSSMSDGERLRKERLERLGGGGSDNSQPDWFSASEEDVASQVLNQQQPNAQSAALDKFETDRFKAQFSAEDWNAQIMANEDKLSPLSMVMQRLAILEEEKQAADRRLEEEYEKRMANEDKYYLEKRRVLEDTIMEIQEGIIYGDSAKGAGEGGANGEEMKSETKFT